VPNVTDGTAWSAERCEGRHHYVSLRAESDHFGLVQVWVALDLKQHGLMFNCD
jgi:hypothetical protein